MLRFYHQKLDHTAQSMFASVVKIKQRVARTNLSQTHNVFRSHSNCWQSMRSFQYLSRLSSGAIRLFLESSSRGCLGSFFKVSISTFLSEEALNVTGYRKALKHNSCSISNININSRNSSSSSNINSRDNSNKQLQPE